MDPGHTVLAEESKVVSHACDRAEEAPLKR